MGGDPQVKAFFRLWQLVDAVTKEFGHLTSEEPQFALSAAWNATGMAEVRWFFDGSPVEAESDGYFTVRRSGTLCAEIYYEDGTEERIIKEIRTR